MTKPASVDVISDVICPWCYIGRRRLEKAISSAAVPVSVRWHPFELNPEMPKQGISRREYRIGKFGSWERSMELDARVIAAGEAEGIQFSFDNGGILSGAQAPETFLDAFNVSSNDAGQT